MHLITSVHLRSICRLDLPSLPQSNKYARQLILSYFDLSTDRFTPPQQCPPPSKRMSCTALFVTILLHSTCPPMTLQLVDLQQCSPRSESPHPEVPRRRAALSVSEISALMADLGIRKLPNLDAVPTSRRYLRSTLLYALFRGAGSGGARTR